MDGCGPFPGAFHPALRLEDKWVQYQILGYPAFVAAGGSFRLENPDFEVRAFDRRSWEAAIWFGPDPSDDPPHLRHNLNEDEVAATALILPHVVL